MVRRSSPMGATGVSAEPIIRHGVYADKRVGIDVAFYLPLTLMEGNFLRTAARPRRVSLGVPFWATRASALRAWDASGMGYLRSSGMANVEFFIRLRLLILLMASPFR